MSRRVLHPFLALLLLLWPSGSVLVAAAWVLPHKSSSRISSTPTVTPRVPPLLLRATQQRRNHQSSTVLLFAGGGFGGSGGASAAAAKNKELKLKPKQQWDRYTTALKKERSVKVGVKVVVADSSNSNSIIDWLEVGAVKSAPGTATEIAVARQRALIVEHAKRLYPLQIPAKALVEWGYANDSDGGVAWVAVDKSVLDDAADGVEKLIGFEGTPDPATGFYCVYNEGRLVKNTDADVGGSGLKPSSKTDVGLKPSSKKLGQ